jgi:hypothetical protein
MQPLDAFPTIPDHEAPIFSAGLSSASIDWSHYDGLDFNNDNFATSSYSQAPSFTGFDFSSMDQPQPALTSTSTSGEISEAGDYLPLTDTTSGTRPSLLSNQYGSDYDKSDRGDIDGYRLSTTSSYFGLPQTQLLASNNFDSLDMDAFLHGGQTSGAYVDNGMSAAVYLDDGKTGPPSSAFDDSTHFQLAEGESDAYWIQNFSPIGVPINQAQSENFDDPHWAQ